MTVFTSSLNILLHNAARHIVDILAESERNIALSERLRSGLPIPGSRHHVIEAFMYPCPTNPYLKANGRWTFAVFPRGIRMEFAEYGDEASALADARVTMRRWESDGVYSFLSGVSLPLGS